MDEVSESWLEGHLKNKRMTETNGSFALYSCRSNDNLDLPKADIAYGAAEAQPITSAYMFESPTVRRRRFEPVVRVSNVLWMSTLTTLFIGTGLTACGPNSDVRI